MSQDPAPDWTAIVAERKIRDAIDAGDFDNLEGKGKPLNLDEPPDPTGMRVINRILKNANALPEWAQIARDIQNETDNLPKSRARAIRAVQMARSDVSRARAMQRVLDDYKERLDLINALIFKYNYIVPAGAQKAFRTFRVREEMNRLEDELGAL